MNLIRISQVLLVLWVGLVSQAAGQSLQVERRQFDAIKAQAEKGDAQAQLSLGTLYATGTGVSRDLAKAAKWHRKAAEQGLTQAQLRLAYEYANGIGLKPDPIEAAKWFHRAAEQGSAEARFELGRCYAQGEGVGENPVEAAKWYRRAAEQNFAPAQHALGECYFEGYGVTKDVPEGVGWIRKAAEQGYAPAENSYGMCYAKGKGVTQDYLQAYKWFNLASAQGGDHNTDAKINLSMAERAMTPEQIAQGQKLALGFRPHASDAGPISQRSEGPAPATVDRTGTVNVKSDDDRSNVFVDGAFVGNPPTKLKLEPGKHVVIVSKEGYKEYRRELQVLSGSDLTLRVILERGN